MERTEALRRLRLFNEKAEELSHTRFAEQVLWENSGWCVEAEIGKPVIVKRAGPDEDTTKAFVLTVRFFRQSRDGISIRQMEEVYESLLVSQKLVEALRETRRVLNEYLQSPTEFTIDGTRPTHNEVLEVFLYGGLCHADTEKKEKLDRWMSTQAMSEVLWNRMIVILATLMQAVFYLHDLNHRVLRALGEPP